MNIHRIKNELQIEQQRIIISRRRFRLTHFWVRCAVHFHLNELNNGISILIFDCFSSFGQCKWKQNGPREKRECLYSGRRMKKKWNVWIRYRISQSERRKKLNMEKNKKWYSNHAACHTRSSHTHKYSIQTSIFTMRIERCLAVACSIDHRVPRFQLLFSLTPHTPSTSVRSPRASCVH